MRLAKTLGILITLSACQTPKHPEEWVCTLFPEDKESICFRAQKESPEGPVVIGIDDMFGYTCRSPEDDKLHNMYVGKLEELVRRGAKKINDSRTNN